METATDGRDGDEPDPRAQLALLESVQDATEAEGWMPPTPRWHAAVLATALAGLALINQGPGSWAIPGAIIGGAATLVAIVDQLRRQRVSPRRLSKPLRVLAFYAFIVAVSCVVVVMWGRIELSADAGQAAPELLGAWLLTAMVFALGITITNRMRNYWAAAQR